MTLYFNFPTKLMLNLRLLQLALKEDFQCHNVITLFKKFTTIKPVKDKKNAAK